VAVAVESSSTRLIFVIDSIDQMDAHSCANINWLPKNMPPKSFLFLSTVSDEQEFENLNSQIQSYYGSEHLHLTEIQPLTSSEVRLMGEEYLMNSGRTLQEDQKHHLVQMLNDTTREKPTVFRSQLFLSIAKGVSSYTNFPRFEATVNGALTVISRRLFAKHGELLTKTVLGLISIPRHGFPDYAILDIISGHDEVLNDVFQYHEPPIRRLPELILKVINQIHIF